MPHADSALVPANITSKSEFWEHIHDQLAALLDGQRNWVTNLANSSSLIYNALLAFPAHFGDGSHSVNWCGFYLDSPLFPLPTISKANQTVGNQVLILGPFCGKPACQLINYSPKRSRGVCADAYNKRQTLVVPDVEAYPGHIACDGETKSEIVVPLILRIPGSDTEHALGVLDLDCLALNGFSEEDKFGLERIAQLIIDACDW